MAEREQFNAERADKLLKLDAGIKTLERAMIGEFQSIDWQKLAVENPRLQLEARGIPAASTRRCKTSPGRSLAEQQQYQAQIVEGQRKWLDEQRKLLQSKVPEWADEARRTKDRAEIATYLEGMESPRTSLRR
jgi:hypothetical protein